jgi:hypothetical protein
MNTGPEHTYVEQPSIGQLVGMGWTLTTGNLDVSAALGRFSFRETILQDLLTNRARVLLPPACPPPIEELTK